MKIKARVRAPVFLKINATHAFWLRLELFSLAALSNPRENKLRAQTTRNAKDKRSQPRALYLDIKVYK